MSARMYPNNIMGFSGNLWTHRSRQRLVDRGWKESDLTFLESQLAEHGLWLGMELDPPEPMPDFMKAKEASPPTSESDSQAGSVRQPEPSQSSPGGASRRVTRGNADTEPEG